MARASSSLIASATALWLILQLRYLANVHATQYANDDSDYNDFDYKELPEKQIEGAIYRPVIEPLQDDFYMVNDPEEVEDRNRRVASNVGEALSSDSVGVRLTSRELDHPQLFKWPSAERVYRYTKHRIPGYDYEELNFLESGNRRRCDERSVYTHCVCQFTCAKPNVVDCYTPCPSGCECREDYVFDERTGECVLPEQCQPDDDYLLY